MGVKPLYYFVSIRNYIESFINVEDYMQNPSTQYQSFPCYLPFI